MQGMKYRSEQGAVFNLGFDRQMCQLPAESECGVSQFRWDKKSGEMNVRKDQKLITAELSSTELSSTALFTTWMCAEVQGYYRLNLMKQGVFTLLADLEERV